MSGKTVALLRDAWRDATVLVAAPGPSLPGFIARREHEVYDKVMACNLAFEQIGPDAICVVDHPRNIAPEAKLLRFRAAPLGVPLCVTHDAIDQWPDHPMAMAWRRRVPVSVDQRRIEDVTVDAVDERGIPVIPYYGGVALSATALALYFGARRIVLAGVDFQGTIHDRNLPTIRKAWLKLVDLAHRLNATIVQSNLHSALQLPDA